MVKKLGYGNGDSFVEEIGNIRKHINYELKPAIDAFSLSVITVGDESINEILENNESSTRTTLNSVFADKATVDEGRLSPENIFNGRTIDAGNYGVTTGSSDISTALSTLIAANPGRTIKLRAGEYWVKTNNGDPTDGKNGGIHIGVPGITLDLTGATLKAIANNSTHYQIIDVDAPDCKVIGGKLIGDVGTHTGSTGEFGHGLSIGGNADRFLADHVYVSKCWGDGIFLWGGVEDVELRGCIADNNRRQGCSIIDAVRPRVEGGAYINTGLTAFTAPGAGIDLEPDSLTERNVVNAVLNNVVFDNNAGAGLLLSGTTRELTFTVTGGRSINNGGNGYDIEGNADGAITGAIAEENALSGFFVQDGVKKVDLNACKAARNTQRGFLIFGDNVNITAPIAELNTMSGIYIYSTATNTCITGGTSRANGQGAQSTYVQVDNEGINTRIVGHVSDAGNQTNKPSFGYVNRPGATGAEFIACRTLGTFGDGPWINLAASVFAFPQPGAVKPTSVAVTAEGIHAALVALGAIT